MLYVQVAALERRTRRAGGSGARRSVRDFGRRRLHPPGAAVTTVRDRRRGARSAGALPLLRHSGVPLWRQLQDDLLRRLHCGEFADCVPGEFALAAEYAVSRQTVRQALRGLRDSGLVDAARGRKSRPAADGEITEPVGALQELLAAARRAGGSVHGVVRTLRVGPDAVIGARLGVGESVPLVYLQRLWFVGERPLALDHLWLPESVGAPLVGVGRTAADLCAELATRVGVRLVSGSERLHAVIPTAAQRVLLDMPPHAAAVAVDRLGRSANGPVEWRHIVIRGDRFAIGADFAARTGYKVHVRVTQARH